jgi:sigma-B regulation protein RsbU (phosphoserine phosphatase)
LKASRTQSDPVDDLAAVAALPSEAQAHKALVVDDSRLQRRILCTLLKRWGYDVSEAASGQEALDLCLDQDFDFVLS